MPRKDGTGPDGKGPKKTNRGVPTPKKRRDGSGGGFGKNAFSKVDRGTGKRGRSSNRGNR